MKETGGSDPSTEQLVCTRLQLSIVFSPEILEPFGTCAQVDDFQILHHDDIISILMYTYIQWVPL